MSLFFTLTLYLFQVCTYIFCCFTLGNSNRTADFGDTCSYRQQYYPSTEYFNNNKKKLTKKKKKKKTFLTLCVLEWSEVVEVSDLCVGSVGRRSPRKEGSH